MGWPIIVNFTEPAKDLSVLLAILGIVAMFYFEETVVTMQILNIWQQVIFRLSYNNNFDYFLKFIYGGIRYMFM